MRHSSGIVAAVDRAVIRARLVAAAEAAAAGAIVAAWSVPAGLLVAAALALWRSPDTSRRAVLRTLEGADPQSRNVIVTADELASGALSAKPAIRDRVEADAATVLSTIRPATLFPVRSLALLTVIAAVAWVAASFVRTGRPLATLRVPSPGETPEAGAAQALKVTVRVEPPGYTRLATAVAVDPAQIEAIERANVRLEIATASRGVTIESEGQVHSLERATSGSFEYAFTAARSGYVLVASTDGTRRIVPLTVKPDALPEVKVTAPGRDLVYDGGNPTIAFTARATDDFGLRSLTLRFTKVSGSGEQFTFADGEISLTVERNGDRDWKGSTSRTLGQLALSEGDMLVYRAVASDMRPGGVEASSDAFYIEVSRLGVAAGDAFTLPEQETRYALSQQMLIVKTDRLNQRRGAMPDAEFVEASQSLAVEQRMIRSEFVFMLGGEIEDEEVEAEQSVEIQAGRLVNRGQRDLRAATVAMSQAEKLLTAGNAGEALKAERAAVEALQRAFARDRYILRALASRSQLDLTRRLTGSTSDVPGWRRQAPDAVPNRAAVALQSLVRGLGEAETSGQVEVLAEFAVRIDPESAALRAIAADLQRLSDAWQSSGGAARTQRLDAIADKVVAEARRVLADAPMPLRGSR